MDFLKPESKVFKLVGPVLLNVELEEAKENVQKRIEFIERELKKIEDLIGSTLNLHWNNDFDWHIYKDAKVKEQTAVGNEIAEMQQKMQQEAAQEAGKIIENKS